MANHRVSVVVLTDICLRVLNTKVSLGMLVVSSILKRTNSVMSESSYN